MIRPDVFPTEMALSFGRFLSDQRGATAIEYGLMAALITRVIVMFFSGLLRHLPQPVLAAIVLVAVTGLVQVNALKHIWRFSRSEGMSGDAGSQVSVSRGTRRARGPGADRCSRQAPG